MFLLALALDAAATLATYREMTRAERGCPVVRDSTDVTVCGLRTADRFRVPLLEPDPGNPLHETVAKERQRYLARTNNCREKSTFLVGCGSAGLTMTAGGRSPGVRVRPMAR